MNQQILDRNWMRWKITLLFFLQHCRALLNVLLHTKCTTRVVRERLLCCS